MPHKQGLGTRNPPSMHNSVDSQLINHGLYTLRQIPTYLRKLCFVLTLFKSYDFSWTPYSFFFFYSSLQN